MARFICWMGFLSILLLFCDHGYSASHVTQLYTLPPNHTLKHSSCRKAQVLQFTSVKLGSIITDSGEFRPIFETEPMLGRMKEWVTIPFKVFQKWVGVHHYTTADKIPDLMGLDQSLSPSRTSYYFFESGEDQVAIRVFNGSKNVSHQGRDWGQASNTDSKLPMEKLDPSLELPERKLPNYQVIELGLLEVTTNVSQGMRWAFAKVADQIDAQFNQLEYTSFGRAIIPKMRGLKIYAQTRQAQVPMFERFGLLPVQNSDGSPKRLASGLILLSADPEVFLAKNFLPQTQPLLKGNTDSQWSESLMREMHKKHIAYMKNLEGLPLHITHPKELIETKEAMQRLLVSTSKEAPHSQVQGQKILLFFNTYFRVINSLPLEFRSNDWQTMRYQVLHAMVQADPFAAYILFYRMLSGKASTANLSPEAEQQFFSNMPVLERIPFGSIVDNALLVF